MRGLLVAGGHGTRLAPTTNAVNKHILPLYDKPLIFYPLCNLILAGANKITIVSTSMGVEQIKKLLGKTEDRLGIEVNYLIQDDPRGISHAISLFCTSSEVAEPVLVILGDNFFYGPSLGLELGALENVKHAVCWTQVVKDPSNYGIAMKDLKGNIIEIVEKPTNSNGQDAVTGLYFFPSDLESKIRNIPISLRGEFEITSLLSRYLDESSLECRQLPRSVYWRDAGTPENLLDVSQFVYSIQKRQQIPIGSPEEASWRRGFISDKQFAELVKEMPLSEYRNLLEALLR